MTQDKKENDTMLKTLIQKELKSITVSNKFLVTFIISSILLIMSVLIGINEYKQAVTQYETVHQMADERIQQVSSWHSVSYREHRRPSPLMIFTSGLSYDIGRWSDINSQSTVKLKNSIYSDDPIFAVFRIIDFTFIVQIIFSLLAILFTFNAVNGEKEQGTLRLIFSNAVPRTKYIIAKCIGTWIGLLIPILIPILISVLIVMLFQIQFTGAEWMRLFFLILLSIIYISIFIVFGVFMSTMSRHSNVSFLLSLVFWISFVLIIPRGGVMAAGNIVTVPRIAEVEGLKVSFAKNKWEEYYKAMEDRFETERETENEDSDEEVSDDLMWAQLKAEDSLRKEVNKEIEKYEAILLEDLENKQRVQQSLGFNLARISPAATYQLAAMQLSFTDIELKSTYESVLKDYRTEFNNYIEKKSENAGPGAGSIMITMDTDKGFDIQVGRDQAIDVSDRPKFSHPQPQLKEILPDVLFNISILLLMIAGLLFGSYYSFQRFDLR